MLRADTGIIQTRRNRMGFDNLAVLILHQISPVAVQYAHRTIGGEWRGMFAGFHPQTSSLDTDEAHILIIDVGVENSHGIGAATDTGDDGIRLTPDQFRHLAPGFDTDDGLKIPHHHGIWVRTGNGAYDVKSIGNVGDPIAHGLVECILERLGAGFDRYYGGAQQFHAKDIGRLALDVLRAHIHHALKPHARRYCGGRHTMLAGTGFGDDTWFSHALGKQTLADAIIDLVR